MCRPAAASRGAGRTKSDIANEQNKNNMNNRAEQQPKTYVNGVDTPYSPDPCADLEREVAARDEALLSAAMLGFVAAAMDELEQPADPNRVCECETRCGMRFCKCKKADCAEHRRHYFAAPEYENGVRGRAREVLAELEVARYQARPLPRFKKNKRREVKEYLDKTLYEVAIKLWRTNGYMPTGTLRMMSAAASNLAQSIEELCDSSQQAIREDDSIAPCTCEVTPCAHAVRDDFFPTLWPGRTQASEQALKEAPKE